MDLAGLLVFATALFIAASSPGPGSAAIVARVLGRGPQGAAAFCAGLAIGDVVWLTLAIAGLATLAQTFQGIVSVIKYLGAAYLLYIACRLWTAPVAAQQLEASQAAEHPAQLVLAGLSLSLGNPKVMAFYLALLPALLDLSRITVLGYALLVVATLTILAIVFAAHIGFAARARQLFTSPRAIRILNRITGTMMAGAAAAVAFR